MVDGPGGSHPFVDFSLPFAVNLNVGDAKSAGEGAGTLASLSSSNPWRLDDTGDFRNAWGRLELTG